MNKTFEILRQYQDGFITPIEAFHKLYDEYKNDIKTIESIDNFLNDLIEFKYIDNLWIAQSLFNINKKLNK